jgi:DNA polymerase elongation subunit (family B)
MKILFFDIETSPNIGLFWEAGWKKSIPYQNIIKERSVICISYKWAGQSKVHSLTWDSKQNDKKMLEEFVKVLNSSDLAVAHNGESFDLPWVKTRALYHGLTDFSTHPITDTLTIARSKLKFNSNTLNYIAGYFGLGGKTETNYQMWVDILLKNDRKVLAAMAKYCNNDVVVLENVYNKLLPVIPTKVHFGVLAGKDKCSCPTCASENLKMSKKRVTAAGTVKYQLKCNNCGKYTTVSESTFNKSSI